MIEICKPTYLIYRKQYYTNLLKLGYNTLKTAKSLLRFKHNKDII